MSVVIDQADRQREMLRRVLHPGSYMELSDGLALTDAGVGLMAARLTKLEQESVPVEEYAALVNLAEHLYCQLFFSPQMKEPLTTEAAHTQLREAMGEHLARRGYEWYVSASGAMVWRIPPDEGEPSEDE